MSASRQFVKVPKSHGARLDGVSKGFSVRKDHSGSYILCDLDGVRISGPYGQKFLAEEAGEKRFAKAGRSQRLCMSCNLPFMSSGMGHRICDKCKRNDGYTW